MKLIVKFNLVLSAVFVVAFVLAGAFTNALLQRNAKTEIEENARMLIDSASAVRMPLSISGTALGTTTSHSMRRRPAPMLRADHTNARSVPRAPLNAPIVTGSMQPRKISRIFEPSPNPSQITVTGISADFGIG